MRLSAVQMPDLIQTAMGGNRMARRPRKMSPLHMVWRSIGSMKRTVAVGW